MKKIFLALCALTAVSLQLQAMIQEEEKNELQKQSPMKIYNINTSNKEILEDIEKSAKNNAKKDEKNKVHTVLCVPDANFESLGKEYPTLFQTVENNNPNTRKLTLFDYYKNLNLKLDPNTEKIIIELFMAGLILGGGYSLYKGVIFFYFIVKGYLMIATLAQTPQQQEHR